MIAALSLAIAAASGPADRLDHGSKWHCGPIGSADRYDLDFTIGPGDAGKPRTKLTIVRATGGIAVGTAGYNSRGGEKNAFFDPRAAKKDPFYPYAEYTQGFYDEGVDISVMWVADKPGVDLYLHTFDWENRLDSARRNQKDYGLVCERMAA